MLIAGPALLLLEQRRIQLERLGFTDSRGVPELAALRDRLVDASWSPELEEAHAELPDRSPVLGKASDHRNRVRLLTFDRRHRIEDVLRYAGAQLKGATKEVYGRSAVSHLADDVAFAVSIRRQWETEPAIAAPRECPARAVLRLHETARRRIVGRDREQQPRHGARLPLAWHGEVVTGIGKVVEHFCHIRRGARAVYWQSFGM
jgi:hypothetical protein